MAGSSGHSCCNSHLPFPSEIRNQIYRYVFSPKYRTICNVFPASEAWTIADLPLLRVSKVTYQETAGLLYNEKAFRVYVSLGGAINTASLPHASTTFGLITHFSLDILGIYPAVKAKSLAALAIATSCIERLKSGITLNLRCYYLLVRGDYDSAVRAAFIAMVEKLRGFRTVAFEITTCPGGPITEATCAEMTKDLEVALGDYVSDETLVLWSDRCREYCRATRIGFYPSEYTRSTVKRRNTRLEALTPEETLQN